MTSDTFFMFSSTRIKQYVPLFIVFAACGKTNSLEKLASGYRVLVFGNKIYFTV